VRKVYVFIFSHPIGEYVESRPLTTSLSVSMNQGGKDKLPSEKSLADYTLLPPQLRRIKL